MTSLEIGALSAVAVVNATLNVTGSTFTGTSRCRPPLLTRLIAELCRHGELRTCDTLIAGNNIGDGASVLLLNSTDTTISGSTFTRNVVTQFGGAISVGSGSLVVEDSTCVMCCRCAAELDSPARHC